MDQELDQRFAGSVEFGFLDFFGGNFANDFVEGAFGNACEITAKKNLAGTERFLGRARAVDQVRGGFGQRFVRRASAGVFGMLFFQAGDFVLDQEGEELQVGDDVTIIGADPELVKLIDAGPGGIKPYGPGFGLAELGAVGISDEGKSEAIDSFAEFFSAKVDTGGDIPPLVGAADLQFATGLAAQDDKIERLEEHVAELGVADAGFAILHTGAHAFFGHHLIDRKVLADVAQEIEVAHGLGPSDVVEQTGRVFRGVKIEQATELFLDLGEIGLEDLPGEQLALLSLAARVANGTGGAARERDGMVALELKAAKPEQRDEIADMEAVRRGIEAGIEGDWSF